MMTRPPQPARQRLSACAAVAIAVACACGPSWAAGPPNKKPDIAPELVRAETGFFEAWKSKDLTYFRDHIAANGVSWGENGTLSRDQQLQEQQNSAKTCTIDGYGLSDFEVVQLTAGAYLLIYKAQQYGSCDGEKLPLHVNGSSVYVFRQGRWQAIYRAQVPSKNQL
jgi:hypothetical protein